LLSVEVDGGEYRANYRLKEVLDGVMEIINDYRQEKEKGQTA
jgi:hypothetical protein